MLTFIYEEDGQAITGFNYKEWTKYVVDNYNKDRKKNYTYSISTRLSLLSIQREVVEDRIDNKDVKFVIAGEVVFLNELAAPTNDCMLHAFHMELDIARDIAIAREARRIKRG